MDQQLIVLRLYAVIWTKMYAWALYITLTQWVMVIYSTVIWTKMYGWALVDIKKYLSYCQLFTRKSKFRIMRKV